MNPVVKTRWENALLHVEVTWTWILVHVDALLDSPKIEADIGETTETSSPDPSPSVAKRELKPLPDTLKYRNLDLSEFLPVIIAVDLNETQEQKLLDVLKEHK